MYLLLVCCCRRISVVEYVHLKSNGKKYSIIHSSYEFLASIHIINPAHNERDNKFQVKFSCVEEKWRCCEWNAKKKYYIAKRKRVEHVCIWVNALCNAREIMCIFFSILLSIKWIVWFVFHASSSSFVVFIFFDSQWNCFLLLLRDCLMFTHLKRNVYFSFRW